MDSLELFFFDLKFLVVIKACSKKEIRLGVMRYYEI